MSGNAHQLLPKQQQHYIKDIINTGLKGYRSISEDSLADGFLPRAGISGRTDPDFSDRSSKLPRKYILDWGE